ncbi:MAG: hypothetical protein Q9187_002869 [Circinaria calcarea]
MWWKRRAGIQFRTISSVHQKHGPVVRLGPNEISVNSPAGLRTIYLGGFQKDEWYPKTFLNYGTPNLVSMLENKPHSVQKRMISNVYSKSYLQSSLDLQLISEKLLFNRFLPIVQSAALDDTAVDVFSLTQGLFMDLTSAYLFGSANGTDFLRDAQHRNHWLKVYSRFKYQLPEERASGEIEMWCLSLCEAAKAFDDSRKSPEGISTKPVVYGRLSQCLDESNLGPQPKHLVIASEMLDHLLAGHETSGITITYLMHEMSRQPSLQSKLREELLTVSPPLTYPKSSSAHLDDKTHDPNSLNSARSIDALPLLDAILQETLRLYAPAPGPLRRLTPFSSTPTTIDGYDNIPGGVKVSSSAYALHRNAGVFPEPERWLPERWLDVQKGKREEMKRWFWAFGNGGRMCIGSNLAMQRKRRA